MDIRRVGVLGCGLMGSGIAQVAATAGYDVVVLEQDQKFLDKGFTSIDKSLGRLVERGVGKGGITPEQKKDAQSRLKGTTNALISPIATSLWKPSSRTLRRSGRHTPSSIRLSRKIASSQPIPPRLA